MEKITVSQFELRVSLYYSEIQEMPLEVDESGEFLQYYELDPAQSMSIEPVKELLTGKLVFTGKKTDADAPQAVILPAENYLFAQCRSSTILKREEWLDMAVEQQKDGLWERKKLKNRLYLRYLFEDGCFVTQIFRPYTP